MCRRFESAPRHHLASVAFTLSRRIQLGQSAAFDVGVECPSEGLATAYLEPFMDR